MIGAEQDNCIVPGSHDPGRRIEWFVVTGY
jgi:hypothetical protein